MGLKRYIVEFGTGADLHGGDVTKAACRAVRDAVSRSCLCGLVDIFAIDDPDKMHVAVKIGCPDPGRLAGDEILRAVPFGTKTLEATQGGLAVRGLDLPALGTGDTIVIAVAALTVSIDVDS
ncbi:Lin0512 family protein [Anaeroselena agilis]|uniref:Lin0512 family protein n=1 Tax=Anaeroselena agilis TaxID=3063788 RepID=A0ABU3NXU7_9FIRM|nr:Lin0512 family protein [Selenomonadales bacterium 4137-cl]